MNPGMASPQTAAPVSTSRSTMRFEAVTSPARSCQAVPGSSAVTATTRATRCRRIASAAGRVKVS